MERFDVSDGFDVHDYRHGLKLLEETRETMSLVNREDFACPACGEVFDRLFVSERRENSLGTLDSPICVVRTGEQVLVLSH